jgi:hypothetical protein
MSCPSDYSKLKNTYSLPILEKFDPTPDLNVLLTNWYSNNKASLLLESMLNRYKNRNMTSEIKKTQDNLDQTNSKTLKQVDEIKDIISKNRNYVQNYLAYISNQPNPDEKSKTIQEFLSSQLGN